MANTLIFRWSKSVGARTWLRLSAGPADVVLTVAVGVAVGYTAVVEIANFVSRAEVRGGFPSSALEAQSVFVAVPKGV